MSDRIFPAPPANPESEAFYQAAGEGRLLLRRCTVCNKPHWYPRAVCPFCFGSTRWEQASGLGVIYTVSVARRVTPPISIAYVTLEEGPTMLTSVVDCDLDTIKIGHPVRVVFKPSKDGPSIPCFTPI